MPIVLEPEPNGIQIRRHYVLDMRLDVATLDLAVVHSFLRPHTACGLTISTLKHELMTDVEASRKAYNCHNLCRKAQPPIELRQDPIPWERWYQHFIGRPQALPEAYFIAKEGDAYIAVCILVPDETEARPDRYESGFTGTIAAWKGRGIAKGMKAHSLLYAHQQRIGQITASVMVINHAMVAINLALGFQVARRHINIYRIPSRYATS